MLKAIDLSLASICGADCIFCPNDRGCRIEEKIMPFGYVRKIIDEISSEEFKKEHQIKTISVGENGDAFLNKDLIKILRYIKSNLLNVKVTFATNFQNFTKDKSELILGEKLIDEFFCDIDGSNSRNYYQVKKLDYQRTMKNLKDFLEVRGESKFSLTIVVITLNRYIKTIYHSFGFYPSKIKDISLKDIPDDFCLIEKQIKKMIRPTDKIIKPWIFGWAERKKINPNRLNYQNYSCCNLARIKTEAFIAPDGTWYACCFDSNNELVFGNIIEKSINEIFHSEKRKKLIEMLEKKKFGKIGGPCKTVNCCQKLFKSDWEKTRANLKKIGRILMYKFKKIFK